VCATVIGTLAFHQCPFQLAHSPERDYRRRNGRISVDWSRSFLCVHISGIGGIDECVQPARTRP
jgi:hypothetical protein